MFGLIEQCQLRKATVHADVDSTLKEHACIMPHAHTSMKAQGRSMLHKKSKTDWLMKDHSTWAGDVRG